MEPVIVRKRMTRNEMCALYPEGYMLVVDKDADFRDDDAKSGKSTAFLVGVFGDRGEAARFQNEDVQLAGSYCIVKAEYFSKEAFEVGYLFSVA